MLRNAATTKQEAAPAKRGLLKAVKRGVLVRPMRVVLYGPEGIGKSTFAGCAPAPIFLGAEEGTSQLDVARLPEPKTWQDVVDSIDELTTEEHSYQTLVIDTLDWLEPVVWEEVCRAGGKQNIEDFGYGKGYASALDLWRALLTRLDHLRSVKGMHVVALAHTAVRTFHNPAGDDFDRYELKLHTKSAGLWKEWCDALLFAIHEEFVRKGENGKSRGVSTGARIVHTERKAAWDAKTRYPLPETLPLDWGEFWAAVERGEPENPDRIRQGIIALLDRVDADTRGKVEISVEKAGSDGVHLSRILNKLTAIVSRNEEQP